MSGLFAVAGPLLRSIDAETAHGLTIATLSKGLNPFRAPVDTPDVPIEVFGLSFANPIGIAAGFDKNADVPDAILAMGFGFAEVGTVTPRPQAGNPRPRLFRLEDDMAVINRMGFNNEGHTAAKRKLQARSAGGGILGVNIGANKDSEDRIADYILGLEQFHDLASYLTINVSSPNTPGLRGLQSRAELEDLIGRLMDKRASLGSKTPMLLKVAPDLVDEELDDIAAVCLDRQIDGLIVSNTTISRPPLNSPNRNEQGGLSGKPLFEMSTVVLAKMYLRTEGKLPLIGVGGIHDGETAWHKVCAGASLVQLYSALVYKGPGLVVDIRRHLARRLKEQGFEALKDAVGCGAANWAAS